MACTTNAWIQDRIDAIQAQIVAYEAAILALGEGGVQSYTLDTGQNRQTVSKLEIRSLQITLNGLYDQYDTLTARFNRCGTTHVRPGF